MKLNICFIGHFTAGGTESATFLVANGLCNKHKVFVLNTCNRKPSFKLKQTITFDYLKDGSIPKRILSLKKYLTKNEIEVLITVESMTGIFSIVAAKLARCKHIVWEHANYYQNQGSRWIQKIRQIELHSVDAYVVLTERDRNNFVKHFRVKARLEQIYNVAKPQGDHLYDMGSKIIVSVGHLRKIKNFIVIPDVAKIVFSKHPDWKWKIYGDTNGDEYYAIKEKVDAYDLQNQVIFCGRCNDMESAYQEASMYVMTSLQEGLPMVLLEAKSSKLPLISFDIETGPDEIIMDGVNGYLVPAYEIEIMAEKICKLIENKEIRKSFSNNSKEGLGLFSEKLIFEKWNSLLNSI